MDTNEARTRMRDIATDALRIVDALAASGTISARERGTIRELGTEARALLSDAGYPGEGVWRGLQRATIGLDTGFDRDDPGFWRELAADLRSAIDTLESLIAPRGREADVHIVG